MARSTKLHRLTVSAIQNAKPPTTLIDGGGLQLIVTSATARSWTFRYCIRKARKVMGLGKYPSVTLDTARDLAAKYRKQVSEGSDPQLERKAERGRMTTFRDSFDSYFEHKKKTLTNPKHIAQWTSTMETYVFPTIGNLSIADISGREIIDVLKPIWHVKPETASRVLQRMDTVFRAAIFLGERKTASPCEGVQQILGAIDKDAQHFPAMHHSNVAAFIRRLRDSKCNAITKLAFEFLILTAARSGQVRYAPANEVDLNTELWTIPAERMKARREHIVPLSPRAIAIYREARALASDSDLLFPTQSGKPYSDMVFTKLLRDWNLGGEVTAHGFRSSFKTWCAEIDKVRDEVSEVALAHADKDKVREAYRRTFYLEERKQLMRRWEAYVLQPSKSRRKSKFKNAPHIPTAA